MPGATHSRPGRALVVLALIILTIMVIYDLSASNSTLASLWNDAFPSQTKGESLRDDLINQIQVPR